MKARRSIPKHFTELSFLRVDFASEEPHHAGGMISLSTSRPGRRKWERQKSCEFTESSIKGLPSALGNLPLKPVFVRFFPALAPHFLPHIVSRPWGGKCADVQDFDAPHIPPPPLPLPQGAPPS